jgi:hypothetical protein
VARIACHNQNWVRTEDVRKNRVVGRQTWVVHGGRARLHPGGVNVAQPKVAAWGFVVAGVLFLTAGVLPAVRGGTFQPTFLAVGVVFLVIGAAAARARRAT